MVHLALGAAGLAGGPAVAGTAVKVTEVSGLSQAISTLSPAKRARI
jgi:hypothetical protein